MKILISALYLVLLSVQVLAQNNKPDENDYRQFNKYDVIRLPAPTGTTDKILGEGFDLEMKRIDKAFAIEPEEVSNVNEYAAFETNMNNEFELNANGRFLFVRAGLNIQQSRRYSVIRVYEIVKTKKIELPYDAEYKGTAKLYASKIHYGHMFEVIIEGDYNSLHGKLAANLVKAGGDISTAISNAKCTTKTFARGLTPRDEKSLWVARSASDFEEKFKKTAPVPIFVEFTSLEPFSTKNIQFTEPTITPGMWRIKRIDFKISGKKPNGNNWDLAILGDGKAPDPFFEIEVGSARPLKTVSTSETFNNVYEDTWYPNAMIQLKRGEIIVISAQDRDTGSNHDYIGFVAFGTNEIFKYEPGQPITAQVNDDNGGFASATIYFER